MSAWAIRASSLYPFYKESGDISKPNNYIQQDVWSDGCGSFSDMNFIF